ncbi:class I SAM-dependent methyltransferase [Nostoc sp. UHCC 0870]|uniref:class I SAM-dependent methyltransferase n=1 Tax=Nostoc sp. UHCC 0870 TaxID=2914041 RepID=UPI001EDCD91D|nr:class I SAM-dependent methyltransferase [Nostoc sp. UHCC 0870]UKO98440.1 class I SAM-dependent methyltransferase [Nostoc sp. UHCC 0870]
MLTGGKPEKIFASYLNQITNSSEKILDVGTSQRFAKELRPYESWFNGKEYIAAGYNPSSQYGKYNCDCHQDIEAMTFEKNHFDGIICLEVLEHVENPFQAVNEIKRVLKKNGMLLLTVPFLLQYHGKGSSSQSHENYPDFWRFTHEGLQQLFKDFQKLDVVPLGGPIEFRLRQFYLSQYLKLHPIRWLVDLIDKPILGKATTRHLIFGVK